MAIKYVSSAAGGSGDGSSPAAAWSLDQALAATPAAGDEVRVMADGTYTRTVTGTITWANGTPAANVVLTGANASGVVDGSRPTVRAAAGSITLLATTSDHLWIRHLILDGGGLAGTTGLSYGPSYGRVTDVKATGCTAVGLDLGDGGETGNNVWGDRLEAANCSGTAGIRAAAFALYFVVARGNACTGIVLSDNGKVHRWASFGNTGGSSCGVSLNSVGYHATGGVAYANGSHGVDLTGNAGFGVFLANVACWGNGGAGFGTDGVKAGAFLFRCASGGNTGGDYAAGNLPTVEGFAGLTGNPFDPAAVAALTSSSTLGEIFAAFAPLATGGGAQLRAAGYPAYLDIGAAQHQDSGGGGGGNTYSRGRVVNAG